MPVRKIRASLVLTADFDTFVGEAGNIFFNIETGELRISNGVTPGGVAISGLTGGGGGGSSDFISVPDLVDSSDSTYFYFGWYDYLNGWYVRRQLRSTSTKSSARLINNVGIANLTAAWPLRNSLNYL